MGGFSFCLNYEKFGLFAVLISSFICPCMPFLFLGVCFYYSCSNCSCVPFCAVLWYYLRFFFAILVFLFCVLTMSDFQVLPHFQISSPSFSNFSFQISNFDFQNLTKSKIKFSNFICLRNKVHYQVFCVLYIGVSVDCVFLRNKKSHLVLRFTARGKTV